MKFEEQNGAFEHDAQSYHRLLVADDIAAATGMTVRRLDPQLLL